MLSSEINIKFNFRKQILRIGKIKQKTRLPTSDWFRESALKKNNLGQSDIELCITKYVRLKL